MGSSLCETLVRTDSFCGPTLSLKPYSVTMARAMRVALLRSWLAPARQQECQ
jgi:hypothetical protein